MSLRNRDERFLKGNTARPLFFVIREDPPVDKRK